MPLSASDLCFFLEAVVALENKDREEFCANHMSNFFLKVFKGQNFRSASSSYIS